MKKQFTLITILMLAMNFVFVLPAKADGITVHVSILGSSKTIFYGNITLTGGCTVTDNSNTQHTFTNPLTVCALDAASKQGNFTYSLQDSSFGMYLTRIDTDTGASDFSTYWSYEASGNLANVGVADSTAILQNNDWLYFHFDPQDANNLSSKYGGAYLLSQQDSSGKITGFDFSSSGFDGASSWAAMALTSLGIDASNMKNGNTSLLDYMKTHAPTLSDSATDWEKRILAIVSLGQNPYDFGSTNYISNLETYYNNHQLGSSTGLNDDFFGLPALLASGVTITDPIATDELTFILNNQHQDGGFSYATTASGSDVDDSAAALIALAFAKHKGLTASNLDTAITNAKAYLLSKQNTDGGFLSDPSFDTTSNTSSTTWAVMALTANGVTGDIINKAKEYIRKNQYLGDGSFAWQLPTPPTAGDTTTTSYAILALLGKSWPLGEFTGTVPNITPTPTPTVIVSPTPTTPQTTPTPTIVYITNTTTNTITNTVYATPTPQIVYTTVEKYLTTQPTPTPEVLGTNIKVPETQTIVKNSNTSGVSIPSIFLGMGIAFLGFYGLQFSRKLLKKN